MTKSSRPDFLTAMFKEASSMKSIGQIEAYLDEGKNLSQFPVQPLYMAIKKLKAADVAEILPRLSSEQRQAFLDLDLWVKDGLDVNQFQSWMDSYNRCTDDAVRKEFVTSESFVVFLKGRFNVWTFDVEEPVYPDHDYYFLTEDNLLLFEYDESFEYVSEVKELIRVLYYEMGVENAYAFLFKLVSDGNMILMEEEYRLKTERLRDIGVVDYYEALKSDNPFSNQAVMDNFIKKKAPTTGDIDPELANQTLNDQALIPYQDRMGLFQDEILKLKDERRVRYLEFNFIRLVNSGITLNGGLKEGAVVMTRAGRKTRALLYLGFDYLINESVPKGHVSLVEGQSVLDYFDFSELYRIGNTLIRDVQKMVKKSLAETNFGNNEEGFLGSFWMEFLDDLFDVPVKLARGSDRKTCEIVSMEEFYELKGLAETFEKLVPFIQGLYASFSKLINEGLLSDHYYLNYNVDQIDFESIILSSIATYSLGLLGKGEKLGLTLEEFQKFCLMAIDDEGVVKDSEEFTTIVQKFISDFGMSGIPNIYEHLIYLLKSQMEGYQYQDLSYDDYRHVGGPIILDTH